MSVSGGVVAVVPCTVVVADDGAVLVVLVVVVELGVAGVFTSVVVWAASAVDPVASRTPASVLKVECMIDLLMVPRKRVKTGRDARDRRSVQGTGSAEPR
jgi:hypothetical protein